MKQIVAGSSLSESMRQTTLFSEYEIFSVEIGEESGKLNEVLLNLSDFFQKTIRYRRQLTSALAYPLFVLGFSFFALWFLLRYLVPMFSGVYARFGSELPSLTRWVVSLSDGIRIYGPYFFILVAAGGFFLFTQRKQLWWRRFFASFLLRLPIFGGIIHKLFLARFCQSMSLLLGARVPLLQAVELIKQMIDFYPIEKALEQTHRNIIQGESLHKSLAAFPFFPAAFIALARVGEESGKLDIMFERLAKTYNADVDQRTQVIGSLIEPILIVFLGLIVALILVAMYLPLFKLSMNMGG
jgi:type IV pilus assembly protein PilC